MALFRTKPGDYRVVDTDRGKALVVPHKVHDAFDERILGLGKVDAACAPCDAICAVFDLEGFTTFCSGIDPELSVPAFMSRFLGWLFLKIKDETTAQSGLDVGVVLFNPLPFFAKFMGDGVMLLWDAKRLNDEAAFNVALTTANVCHAYKQYYAPEMRREFSNAPKRLRAGVARGRVIPVGNGTDFVGPCINLAARLQKIVPGVSWCMSQRGFSLKACDAATQARLVLKEVSVRGVGNNELVYVALSEYADVKEQDRSAFRDV
jgi:class 3 adenylate cyclase